MTLPSPHFLVNLKVYPDTLGRDGLAVARTIEQIGIETSTSFVLVPQLPDIRMLASETDIPILSPRADPVTPGRGTGKVLPETLVDAGAAGTLINHSETPETLANITATIRRCQDVGLDTVVCVDSIKMGLAVAELGVAWILFEQPAKIGTDEGVSESYLERIGILIERIEKKSSRTNILVGGGFKLGNDIRSAFERGVDGVGAASAVALASDRMSVLTEIGKAVPSINDA